jgi:hypothetical protein
MGMSFEELSKFGRLRKISKVCVCACACMRAHKYVAVTLWSPTACVRTSALITSIYNLTLN